MDMPWWVGFALSLFGLLLLAITTVFNLPIIPNRFRAHMFWLALIVFLMGLSLSVVFT